MNDIYFIERNLISREHYIVFSLNGSRKYGCSSRRIKQLLEDKGTSFFCYDVFDCFDFQVNSKNLYDLKILYALAGIKNSNLFDLCTKLNIEHQELKYTYERASAIQKSYKMCGVNLSSKLSFYFFKNLMIDYFSLKKDILSKLIKKMDKKEVFSFYKKRIKRYITNLSEISSNKIQINTGKIALHNSHFVKNFNTNPYRLQFNLVSARHGRLNFAKSSGNIYGMPSECRDIVEAKNGYILTQFDYKSFQPRLAIFSCQKSFYDKFKDVEDIYSVVPGDREELKITLLRWMYSENYQNKQLEEVFKPIQDLRKKVFTNSKQGYIINKFGRPLYFDDKDSENLIFQYYITSLEVDSIMLAISSLNQILKNVKTKILFPFHDAIICEVHKNEVKLIPKIQEYLETIFKIRKVYESRFKIEYKTGKNFKEMYDGINV